METHLSTYVSTYFIKLLIGVSEPTLSKQGLYKHDSIQSNIKFQFTLKINLETSFILALFQNLVVELIWRPWKKKKLLFFINPFICQMGAFQFAFGIQWEALCEKKNKIVSQVSITDQTIGWWRRARGKETILTTT